MKIADLVDHDVVARQSREADPAYAAHPLPGPAERTCHCCLRQPVPGAVVARVERGDYFPRLDGLEQLARHGVLRVRIDENGTVIETG